MSTKIEVNDCFVIRIFNHEWVFSTFTFVVEVMFNLRTFLQVLANIVIKILT